MPANGISIPVEFVFFETQNIQSCLKKENNPYVGTFLKELVVFIQNFQTFDDFFFFGVVFCG